MDRLSVGPDEAPGQVIVRMAMSEECVHIVTQLGVDNVDDFVRDKMSVKLVDLLIKEGYAFWHAERENNTNSWVVNLRFYNDKSVAKKMKELIGQRKRLISEPDKATRNKQ